MSLWKKRFRCKNCKGLNTQRYGKGRIHCTECRYTFRPFKKKRHTDKRWLKSHLLDGSSFRRLAQRWGVSHGTAWLRVQRTQNKKVKPSKLIVLHKADNLTVLLLDGKHFMIRRHPYTLYVAINGLSGEPLCWILLARYELREGYDLILRYLKAQRRDVKAIVSDWHHGIISSLQDYYPGAVHQRCAAHVLQDVLRKLGGKRFLSSQCGKILWRRIARVAIGYSYLFVARMQVGRLKKEYPQCSRAWRVLEESLPDIYQFTKDSSVQIPRTSNRIENFMGQLEQRLKTFRGMKTPETRIKIITSLIVIKWKNQPRN